MTSSVKTLRSGSNKGRFSTLPGNIWRRTPRRKLFARAAVAETLTKAMSDRDGGVGSPMPTLVLTAYLDPSVAIQALEAGAIGALSKVASVSEAVWTIERLLEGVHSET